MLAEQTAPMDKLSVLGNWLRVITKDVLIGWHSVIINSTIVHPHIITMSNEFLVLGVTHSVCLKALIKGTSES